MPDTFESLFGQIQAAPRVDYLVVGGVAVCLNGFVRTTQDLDLLVEASPANLQRSALVPLPGLGEGFAQELSLDDFPMEEGAIRVIEDFVVDLFTIMRSRTYADFATTARRWGLGDRRRDDFLSRSSSGISDRAEVFIGFATRTNSTRWALRYAKSSPALLLLDSA